MRSTPGAIKLPAKLIQELGEQDALSRNLGARRDVSSYRDNRRIERTKKRAHTNGPSPSKRRKIEPTELTRTDHGASTAKEVSSYVRSSESSADQRKPQSILKTRKQPDKPPRAEDKPRRKLQSRGNTSRAIATKLIEDNEKIAALEKKLGLRGKKGLPQAFKDDGLDDLLEGLDDGSDDSTHDSNSTWPATKRQQAKAVPFEGAEDGDFSSGEGSAMLSIALNTDISKGSENSCIDGLNADDMLSDLRDESEDLISDDGTVSLSPPHQKEKENPYVAPRSHNGPALAKYIPPSLRTASSSENEALIRLRRQTQGLVNRLTEGNLITMLNSIEGLYRDYPRQHVTSTLVEILLTSVCEPTSLPDTLIILPAGFIAAIYKIIGTDFGAHVIERTVQLFDDYYMQASKIGRSGPQAATFDSRKETSNLVTLLAELYNFQVIRSNLIFDYIRHFLGSFSELNAELLLKIIRISGPQLRQDDTSALKDIVNMLRLAVAHIGEENLSVRARFLIETINDLKNHRIKTGLASSSVASQHTIHMKKILGTLNTRSFKVSEPLRIGLKDIRESDKKGKWWLIGASWAGTEVVSPEVLNSSSNPDGGTHGYSLPVDSSGETDLVWLAREQRMNTDIRRAIFITIMSASDYQDAYLRLMKLKLKKIQELEIPKVLIHCSGAEKSYNPYYTLIAKKVCGDRKLKMAFQFSLWEIFRRLGEDNSGETIPEAEEDEDFLHMRQLVNFGKMFGTMIADNSLSLSVLKNLNLNYLQPRTRVFLEVLCITLLLQTQQHSWDQRDEQAVTLVASKVKDNPQLSRNLQYFLKRVVAKTDIAGGSVETATVKWACGVAVDTLQSLITSVSERA